MTELQIDLPPLAAFEKFMNANEERGTEPGFEQKSNDACCVFAFLCAPYSSSPLPATSPFPPKCGLPNAFESSVGAVSVGLGPKNAFLKAC